MSNSKKPKPQKADVDVKALSDSDLASDMLNNLEAPTFREYAKEAAWRLSFRAKSHEEFQQDVADD